MAGRTPESNLLLLALTDPKALGGLGAAEWDMLMRQARRTNLHGRLAVEMESAGLVDTLPTPVRNYVKAARVVADENSRMIRWELNRIERALADVDITVVLLKGAAYVAAGLPPARGRLATDVDILVPRAALDRIEAALVAHGWEHTKVDSYSQRYYRAWMHELPPLQHRERLTAIDVHHTILPPTGRLHPDPRVLLREAREIDESPFKILSPSTMVLHSAVHLFQDGDLSLAIRDLADIDDLLGCFGGQPGFWRDLIHRARELDLSRPLFYALRYADRLLNTPVPADAMAAIQAGAPPRTVLAVMDRLIPRVLLPDDPDDPSSETALAARLLYIRSHWLRMPPALLARHLARKAWGRLIATVPLANVRFTLF